MIFYFSGTGNSKYVAETIADYIGDDLRSIPKVSPNILRQRGEDDQNLGFVFPIYSWGVPPIILDFISRIKEDIVENLRKEKVSVWVVMTCGDEVAEAPMMIERTLNDKGLTLNGIWSVIMPNNYVLLPGFDVDSKEIESEKLAKAPARIMDIAAHINARNWQKDYVEGKLPKLKTRLIYPLFKRWGIFPQKWKSLETCIGCGICERVCPVGNIKIKGGRPNWGKECLSCLACYHRCPQHAVAYGKMTKGKGQYYYSPDEHKWEK